MLEILKVPLVELNDNSEKKFKGKDLNLQQFYFEIWKSNSKYCFSNKNNIIKRFVLKKKIINKNNQAKSNILYT